MRWVPVLPYYPTRAIAESPAWTAQFANNDSIQFWNFGDNPNYAVAQLPCPATVNKIFTLAERCFTNNHPESSWNNDVHSRVLDWILRDRPGKDDLVDYRCWFVNLSFLS